jgi:replicative DNA helicase
VRPASESGKLLVGFLLEAKDPRRYIQASGISAETLGDKFLSSLWALIDQTSQQGRHVDAATIFAAGVSRKLLADEDLSLLQSLQARNTLDERGFMQVAHELRVDSHNKLIGRQLTELGQELLKGGSAEQAHGRFRAIVANYARMHSAAKRGSAVVIQAMEEFERRKREGMPALVPTCIPLLDTQTGGLPPKLTVILGPPGTFKSGLMAAMLERQLQLGLRPLVVSLEDGSAWAPKRYLAKRLGMKVRDVFAKDFPDEAKAADEANALSNLMHASWWLTKREVRTSKDIVREAVKLLAQDKITNVFIDNARAVKGQIADPSNRFAKTPDRRMIASEMYEDFAEASDFYGLPFALLAHTSRDYFKRTEGKGPPIMSDIGETGDAEKDVRLILALWKRKGCLRITVGKQNEGESDHDNPPTIELDHVAQTALVDPESGRAIDLRAEERKDREEERGRRDEWSAATSVRRAALKKKLMETEQAKQPKLEPKPEAQPDLFKGAAL